MSFTSLLENWPLIFLYFTFNTILNKNWPKPILYQCCVSAPLEDIKNLWFSNIFRGHKNGITFLLQVYISPAWTQTWVLRSCLICEKLQRFSTYENITLLRPTNFTFIFQWNYNISDGKADLKFSHHDNFSMKLKFKIWKSVYVPDQPDPKLGHLENQNDNAI